jgi:hypothetical protein
MMLWVTLIPKSALAAPAYSVPHSMTSFDRHIKRPLPPSTFAVIKRGYVSKRLAGVQLSASTNGKGLRNLTSPFSVNVSDAGRENGE